MPQQSAKSAVLAIDIGTSSIRAMAFDIEGLPIPGLMARVKHSSDRTEGGSTFDPQTFLSNFKDCLTEILSLPKCRDPYSSVDALPF